MTALANIALIGALVLLSLAVMGTLTGLDRWLEDRRHRRTRDRFDIFTDGGWRK